MIPYRAYRSRYTWKITMDRTFKYFYYIFNKLIYAFYQNVDTDNLETKHYDYY